MSKVLNKKKLSDFEFHVELEIDGRVYSDNFSLPGLKKNLECLEKGCKAYKVTKAMIEAVEGKRVKKAYNGNAE